MRQSPPTKLFDRCNIKIHEILNKCSSSMSLVKSILKLTADIVKAFDVVVDKASNIVKIVDFVEVNEENIFRHSGVIDDTDAKNFVRSLIKDRIIQSGPFEIVNCKIGCKFESQIQNESESYTNNSNSDCILKSFSEPVAKIIVEDKASPRYLRAYFICADTAKINIPERNRNVRDIILECCRTSDSEKLSNIQQEIRYVIEPLNGLFGWSNGTVENSWIRKLEMETYYHGVLNIKINYYSEIVFGISKYIREFSNIKIDKICKSDACINLGKNQLGKLLLPDIYEAINNIEILICELQKFKEDSKEYQFLYKYIIYCLWRINGILKYYIVDKFFNYLVTFLMGGYIESYVSIPLYKLFHDEKFKCSFPAKFKYVFERTIRLLLEISNSLHSRFYQQGYKIFVIEQMFPMYKRVEIIPLTNSNLNRPDQITKNNPTIEGTILDKSDNYQLFLVKFPVDIIRFNKYLFAIIDFKQSRYNDYELASRIDRQGKQNTAISLSNTSDASLIHERNTCVIGNEAFISIEHFDGFYQNFEVHCLSSLSRSLASFTRLKNIMICYPHLRFMINILKSKIYSPEEKIKFLTESTNTFIDIQNAFNKLIGIAANSIGLSFDPSFTVCMTKTSLNNAEIRPLIQNLYFEQFLKMIDLNRYFKTEETKSLMIDINRYFKNEEIKSLLTYETHDSKHTISSLRKFLTETIIPSLNCALIQFNDYNQASEIHKCYSFLTNEINRIVFANCFEPINEYLNQIKYHNNSGFVESPRN